MTDFLTFWDVNMNRFCWLVSLSLVYATPVVLAADLVWLEGGHAKITEADILADVQRMPPEARKQTLSRPDSVTQTATNLVIRREMAAKAETEGLAADPVVAASLRIARERILSDAWLATQDLVNTPTDAQLDALALTAYKVSPARFDMPEMVRVRHLLVAKGPDAGANAEKLLAEIKGGADFQTVAKQHSADRGSASKGGDLGLFPRGRMVDAFDKAAFALNQPGELSGLVESNFGVHIIQLVEKQPARVKPYEEVRESLRSEAAAQAVKDRRSRTQRLLQDRVKVDTAAVDAFVREPR